MSGPRFPCDSRTPGKDAKERRRRARSYMPNITLKEREYLDKKFPVDKKWLGRKIK